MTVETLAHKNAFISLKDHKGNFQNSPTCRLINPTKSEIGKVTKRILDKINKAIVSKTGIQQWKNTKATLKWFTNIQNKEQHSFIAIDIMNFYPSISHELLNNALSFATNYINISAEDKEIILPTKQSLLFNNGTSWAKKNSPNSFDVTIGSFDGSETCELVGSYLLHQRPENIRKKVGLYRNDRQEGYAKCSQTMAYK